MRKFTVALLAVALILGVTMSASAADIKVSGSYYIKSLFESNNALAVYGTSEKSQAFTHQGLRVQPEVAIADGLKLVMRFDALEKVWGSPDWAGSPSCDSAGRLTGSSCEKVQQNIEFERVYIDFNTAYGKVLVGYQNFAAWGTNFGDTSLTRPGVKFIAPVTKDLTIIAAVEKGQDKSRAHTTSGNCLSNATTYPGYTDADTEIFDLGAIYKLSNGEVGLLYQYIRNANNKPISSATAKINALIPYYKGTFGNVYVEAEGVYAKGSFPEFDPGSSVDLNTFGGYVNVKAGFAPYYVGGMLVYLKGDNVGTPYKKEGSVASNLLLGQAFSPTLMMWNDQFATWAGAYKVYGAGATGQMDGFMDNCRFGQVYAGYKPTANTEIKVAYAMAQADEKAFAEQVAKDYGRELDVVATYKIYDNLVYELGAGYFWVGDYFKGASTTITLNNDYLLYHKLTLNF